MKSRRTDDDVDAVDFIIYKSRISRRCKRFLSCNELMCVYKHKLNSNRYMRSIVDYNSLLFRLTWFHSSIFVACLRRTNIEKWNRKTIRRGKRRSTETHNRTSQWSSPIWQEDGNYVMSLQLKITFFEHSFRIAHWEFTSCKLLKYCREEYLVKFSRTLGSTKRKKKSETFVKMQLTF